MTLNRNVGALRVLARRSCPFGKITAILDYLLGSAAPPTGTASTTGASVEHLRADILKSI